MRRKKYSPPPRGPTIKGNDFVGQYLRPPDAHPVLLAELVESITQSALGNYSLRDRDMIEALTALVRSFETRANSGLHYEPTSPSLTQQALIEELREVMENCVQEGRELGTPRLREGDALALVFVLRLALDRSSGRPLSRGCLDFLRAQFQEDGSNIQTHIVLP